MRTYKMMLPALGIAAALCTTPASAQSSGNLKADIPFAFHVGKQKLPAGTYVLKAGCATEIVAVQNDAGRTELLTITLPNNAPSGPKHAALKFRMYGKQAYLAGTWNPSTMCGRSLGKSAAEREAEKANTPLKVAWVRATQE